MGAEWIAKTHQVHLNNVEGQIHIKRMMRQLSQHLPAVMLALNRVQLKTMTILTGYDCLREYLHKVEPICILCNGEEEIAYLVVFQCTALERRRLLFLQQNFNNAHYESKRVVRWSYVLQLWRLNSDRTIGEFYEVCKSDLQIILKSWKETV